MLHDGIDEAADRRDVAISPMHPMRSPVRRDLWAVRLSRSGSQNRLELPRTDLLYSTASNCHSRESDPSTTSTRGSTEKSKPGRVGFFGTVFGAPDLVCRCWANPTADGERQRHSHDSRRGVRQVPDGLLRRPDVRRVQARGSLNGFGICEFPSLLFASV